MRASFLTRGPATRAHRPAVVGITGTVLLLTGCAASDSSPSSGGATAASARPSASPSGHPDQAAGGALPSSHVHGVAVNPADDRVYLATHEGLLRWDPAGPTRVGPVIDLMGFTLAGPHHFYASGHPGPGVDLPQPVGLIESRDGGRTWTGLSRQGESDFHALTTAGTGVVGYDGTALRITADGTTWKDLDPPVEPYSLAASPDGTVLVATSPGGPVRSTDSGATWSALEDAPLLQLVDWADGRTVAGVTPTGTVTISTDGGATWTDRGSVSGMPQALAASTRPDGSLRLVAVTTDGVLDSDDGGRTFRPFTPG